MPKLKADTKQNEDSPEIVGSFKQAFSANLTVAYMGRQLVGAFNPPVAEMANLSQVLRGLLAASPVILTMLTQIPMTHQIENHGGKKQVLMVLGGALAGMVIVTGLSAATDITKIDHFDWKYVTMLGSGCLIGLGSGAFPLMINSMKWARKLEHVSLIQASYSSIVDLASVTTPVVIYLLKSHGYHVPFALYSGLLLAGIAAAAKFIVPPPYLQVRKKYSREVAIQKAIAAGQLEEWIGDDVENDWPTIIKNHTRTLFNWRGVTLNFAFFAALGSFFVTETIFPTLLKNAFEVSDGEAIVASSLANLLTILARIPASQLIYRYDRRSGGVNVHLLGCAMSALGTIPLAFFKLPRAALYGSVALLNTGYGMQIITAANIAHPWKKPANKKHKEYNVNTMLGILGTLGTAGGIALPIGLGLMVDAQGESGYRNYFILIMMMMFVSAFLVYFVNKIINIIDGNSLCTGPANFFRAARNACSRDKYTFGNELPIADDSQMRITRSGLG